MSSMTRLIKGDYIITSQSCLTVSFAWTFSHVNAFHFAVPLSNNYHDYYNYYHNNYHQYNDYYHNDYYHNYYTYYFNLK